MKRMSIERQMEAIRILQSCTNHDLNYQMQIEHNHKVIVTNKVGLYNDEVKKLMDAGFLVNVYSNIATTDDEFGLMICVFEANF